MQMVWRDWTGNPESMIGLQLIGRLRPLRRPFGRLRHALLSKLSWATHWTPELSNVWSPEAMPVAMQPKFSGLRAPPGNASEGRPPKPINLHLAASAHLEAFKIVADMPKAEMPICCGCLADRA